MIFADCDEICVIKAFEVDSLNCVNWILPINFYAMNFTILKLLRIVLLANKLKCESWILFFFFLLVEVNLKSWRQNVWVKICLQSRSKHVFLFFFQFISRICPLLWASLLLLFFFFRVRILVTNSSFLAKTQLFYVLASELHHLSKLYNFWVDILQVLKVVSWQNLPKLLKQGFFLLNFLKSFLGLLYNLNKCLLKFSSQPGKLFKITFVWSALSFHSSD